MINTKRISDPVTAAYEERWFTFMERSRSGIPGGKAPRHRACRQAESPTLAILQDKWQALRQEIHEFVTALNEDKMREPLAYKDLKGVPYKQPLAHLMRHVINHSTYHRGQVTTMLRQLGVVPPPSIDLITYYREVDEVLESTKRSVEKRP